ncbi:hypothetical protein ADK60_38935 [Streptomyces sp. XY431]|nr:hypothetical protein ADK60_38935 [Streptomyces sp. XY431]
MQRQLDEAMRHRRIRDLFFSILDIFTEEVLDKFFDVCMREDYEGGYQQLLAASQVIGGLYSKDIIGQQ